MSISPLIPGRFSYIFAGMAAGLVLLLYIFEFQANPILNHTVIRLVLATLILFPYRKMRFASGVFYLSLALLFGSILSYTMGPIIPVMIAFGLAYLINPLIDWLEKKWYLKRSISTLILLLSVVFTIVLFFTFMIPFIFSQLTALSQNFPQYLSTMQGIIQNLNSFFNQYGISLGSMIDESALNSKLQNLLNNLAAGAFENLNKLGNMVSQLMNILIFPFAFYYFSKEFNNMKSWIRDFIPLEYRDRITVYYRDIDQIVGSFVRGQVIICSLVGLLTYLGLLLIGFDYALLIALMVSILSLIPYIGTLVSVITAVMLALISSSLFMAVKVLIIMELIQFTEGNFITPRIMAKTIGMHPLLIMVGVVIFTELFGFWGMLMAVLLSAISKYFFLIFLVHYRQSPWYLKRDSTPSTDEL